MILFRLLRKCSRSVMSNTKPMPIVEYVYVEPQTEAEKTMAQCRLDRAYSVLFEHTLQKIQKKKQSENQT